MVLSLIFLKSGTRFVNIRDQTNADNITKDAATPKHSMLC